MLHVVLLCSSNHNISYLILECKCEWINNVEIYTNQIHYMFWNSLACEWINNVKICCLKIALGAKYTYVLTCSQLRSTQSIEKTYFFNTYFLPSDWQQSCPEDLGRHIPPLSHIYIFLNCPGNSNISWFWTYFRSRRCNMIWLVLILFALPECRGDLDGRLVMDINIHVTFYNKK
jgi:hypothetical protein